MTSRNFKHIEHRKKCRVCNRAADIRHTDGRLYCAADYHMVYQIPKPAHPPVTLTPEDVVFALTHGAIGGRVAAELLDKVIKQGVAR